MSQKNHTWSSESDGLKELFPLSRELLTVGIQVGKTEIDYECFVRF